MVLLVYKAGTPHRKATPSEEVMMTNKSGSDLTATESDECAPRPGRDKPASKRWTLPSCRVRVSLSPGLFGTLVFCLDSLRLFDDFFMEYLHLEIQ